MIGFEQNGGTVDAPTGTRARGADEASIYRTGGARAADVPESTLRRWLRSDADFIRAYRETRRKVTEHANGLLQTASSEAAAKLIALMRDVELPASVQLAAAVQILDRSASSELEERVAALEDRQSLSDSPTERVDAVQ